MKTLYESILDSDSRVKENTKTYTEYCIGIDSLCNALKTIKEFYRREYSSFSLTFDFDNIKIKKFDNFISALQKSKHLIIDGEVDKDNEIFGINIYLKVQSKKYLPTYFCITGQLWEGDYKIEAADLSLRIDGQLEKEIVNYFLDQLSKIIKFD